VKNIFDAYQPDIDLGAGRDSAYIYGPSMPRTYFFGVKLYL
jgi:outer membrane receptor for ferrienterochelin and colicins